MANLIPSVNTDLQYESRDVYPVIPAGTSDEQFIEIWLHNRPQKTQDAYKRDAYRFLIFLAQGIEDTKKSRALSLLKQTTLPDLQDFADTLGYLKPTSKARVLKAIKSLFTFAEKTGYKEFNIGAAVRLPKIKRRLAQRILSEEQVRSIIAQAQGNVRNHALLRFLYISGARVSEACGLTWADVQDRDFEMGQVTLDGKGDKERTILLPASMFQQLKQLRDWQAEQLGRPIHDSEPVFMRMRGGGGLTGTGALDPSQVHRIVEAAAVAAHVQTYQGVQRRKNKNQKIETKQVVKSRVSPHYFRHAHASHALDRGVPPHVVMEILGHTSLDILSVYTHARPNESSAVKLSA